MRAMRIWARWHRDHAFLREVYAQALGSVTAAFLVYTVVVLSGLGPAGPLRVAVTIILVLSSLSWLAVLAEIWSERRYFFGRLMFSSQMTPASSSAEQKAYDLYGSFILTLCLSLGMGLVLVVTLIG